MRIFVRRRSGPLSVAIVLLALVFVLSGWVWAARHIPSAEAQALRTQCPSLLLPVGLHVAAAPGGASRRTADYLCLPQYFASREQFEVTSTGGGGPQVRTFRTWGPMLFVGVLAALLAVGIYTRSPA